MKVLVVFLLSFISIMSKVSSYSFPFFLKRNNQIVMGSDLPDRADLKSRVITWFDERESRVEGVSLKEKTLTIQGLAEKLERKQLNLHPDYQRSFVWSPKRSARLIETVLGGRFIPPVVLHEKRNGNPSRPIQRVGRACLQRPTHGFLSDALSP